ncbi:MAG: TonB-dependent receptor domain-containing protein, partial [Candidatus Binatia bacterium]
LCTAFGAQPFTLDTSRRETNFSPKVTVQYFPWDDLALFATRATGFKSGGYNNVPITPNDIEVDEEETVSWEAGAKGTIFDGTLSYSGTFFNMDVENLQVQQFLGGTTIVVRNAAGAQSRGFELDAQWLTPWEPLSIRAAGSITDGSFKDFPDAPAPRSFASAEQDLSDERLPFLSERQLNVTPELRFPLPWRGLVLGGALDVLYASDIYLDVDLDPATLQDDYVLLNGRVQLAALDERLSFAVSVENLADEDILQFATDTPVFSGFMVLQEYGRTVSAEIRYAW